MKKVQRILILGLKSPPSFWDFLEALKFLGFKVALPPLGPITVAAMIPKDGYEVRFVDMRVDDLPDEYIKWADLVLVSVITDQLPFLKKIIARCNNLKKPVVVGGPCTTSCSDIVEDMGATSIVIGEAEDIFLQLLEDGVAGKLKKRYQSSGYPDLTKSLTPDYSLLKPGAYPQMSIQWGRGCPFGCEFCETAKLNGKIPRFKTVKQVLAGLQAIYDTDFEGPIFFVDDNLLGNPKELKKLLPEIIIWQKNRKYPFSFFAQVSINLAGMPDVMKLMVEAGFTTVFIGVESPNQEALKKAGKGQNVDIDLVEAIKTINGAGLITNIGIIFGLDNEPPSTFDDVPKFAGDAGIPVVMAGLLVVPKGTPLRERLESEGRLLPDVPISSNTNLTALNFIPKSMSEDDLIKGYKLVLQELYEPTLNSYFERCWGLFKQLKMVRRRGRAKIGWLRVIRAVYCSLRYQFFSRKQGPAYRKFLWRVLCHCPKRIPQAVILAAMGYHLAHHTDLIVNS